MKKILLVIGMVLAAGIVFTSESPSLDGRAVVADQGVFPKGLFAKTVGYLPGDTISVTNPANAERVDILVIGSLDPSEGVAVMLSPEAASALNIKQNSNNLVKLTKRNGNADEIANGSAVIASSSPVEAAASEEKPLSQVIEEAMESGVPVDVAEKQAVAKAEEELADKMFDKADEDIQAQEEAEAAEEEAVVVEEIAEEESAEEEEAELAETSEEAEPEYPEYEGVKDELVEDELAGEVEENPEEEFVEAEVQDAVPEEKVAEAVEPEAIEEDEYEAIVLVPSESKSPESNLVDEPVIVEDEEKLIVESPAPASGVAYLNGFDELASQKYYVQIAVYKSSENIEQIASQYADRYPITVVQQGSKSPVLVGPLNVDEYGVVLERFKSYGFKDAFVKYPR
ncbi:MAG: SPOR domain-containing protein [Treponema sp.]|nr:SPOR domain-containing protein [Treponema sp.]MEE3434149.1 SPOR domain-containing protein [Treponema sp.]